MSLESKSADMKIELELFGHEFVSAIDENTLLVCEAIRKDAAERLNEMKNSEENGEDILEKVGLFLKESIGKLLGDRMVSELSGYCSMSVPELTGVLCYAISEIGAVFANGTEKEGVGYADDE